MVTLSIIVPVYNEAKHLAEAIDNLMASPGSVEREWIFIDDGSTDGSQEILARASKHYGFRVVEQVKNQGKGAAIAKGIECAVGKIIIIQDADFEYDPAELEEVVAPILLGKADIVYGSRYLHMNTARVHRTYHYLINRVLTLLSNLLSGIYISDMETCYKAFRADIGKSLRIRSKRFGIEIELTAYFAKTRARICEVPISYYPRLHLHGKKIGWRDGVAALFHLVYFNCLVSKAKAFTHIDSSWDAFLNHVPQRGIPAQKLRRKTSA